MNWSRVIFIHPEIIGITISWGIEINQFALIFLILWAKIGEDPLQKQNMYYLVNLVAAISTTFTVPLNTMQLISPTGTKAGITWFPSWHFAFTCYKRWKTLWCHQIGRLLPKISWGCFQPSVTKGSIAVASSPSQTICWYIRITMK